MTETPVFQVLDAVLAVVLALVHLFAGRVRFRAVPRSFWLSGAGGVSVAYVFVHVLPELQARQAAFDEASVTVGFLEHHIYLLALAGFTLFYGLEQLAQRSADAEDGTVVGDAETESSAEAGIDAGTEIGAETEIDSETETTAGVFWVHVGSFAAYNALVGYLLVHREDGGLVGLAFFAVAMALHFVVNDHGLRDHHHEAYDEIGRWLLAGGILAGLAVGLATTVTEQAVASLFALLAGGIVLNVIKEELPEERRSNFWAFAGGAASYSLVLLFI